MRLVFIADKSQSYVDMQKESFLDTWDIASDDTQKVDHVGDAGVATLFGEMPVALLYLEKPDHIKSTVTALEKAVKEDRLASLVGNGLIIMTQVPQRSLKKMNTLVAAQGGTVVDPLHDSKSKESPASKLLKTLNLSADVRRAILEYVGEDYDSLIPIVRNLSEIPKNKHRSITVDQMMMRLPQTPGLMPIWEVWNEMERGNLQEAVRAYRRFPKSASIGVVIHIKNTISLAYRIASIVEHQPNSTKKEMQDLTDVKSSFRFDKMKGLATKNGVQRLAKALDVISTAETRLKGGWPNTISSDVVEIALVSLYRIMRH